MNPKFEPFLRRLDYQFDNVQLLEQALTHRSFGGVNNERLEYLGDAVLDLCAGEMLYHKFPLANEGVLSNLRSQLVCQKALAQVARDLGIPEVIILGRSATTSGGHQRDSILSDAVEALIGAIFLDKGWDAARDFVNKHMRIEESAFETSASTRDAKSRLQEFLQAQKLPPPQYELKEISGPGHSQNFLVVCRSTPDAPDFEGLGASRRAAEQSAAGLALDYLTAQATENALS